MQTFIITIVLFLCSSMGMKAQTHYEQELTTALELWQDQKPQEAAKLFEHIATAEGKKWLPYYYSSQIKIVESFDMTNRTKKEQLLREAQGLLNKAKELEADEVELMVLQAMLHTSRLTIDPDTYGMSLAPVITEIYAEAAKIAPENPRLVLSKTEWEIGSAPYYGEDPKIYCPDLKAGLALFENEDDAPTQAPTWGKERLQRLIAQTCDREN